MKNRKCDMYIIVRTPEGRVLTLKDASIMSPVNNGKWSCTLFIKNTETLNEDLLRKTFYNLFGINLTDDNSTIKSFAIIDSIDRKSSLECVLVNLTRLVTLYCKKTMNLNILELDNLYNIIKKRKQKFVDETFSVFNLLGYYLDGE